MFTVLEFDAVRGLGAGSRHQRGCFWRIRSTLQAWVVKLSWDQWVQITLCEIRIKAQVRFGGQRLRHLGCSDKGGGGR